MEKSTGQNSLGTPDNGSRPQVLMTETGGLVLGKPVFLEYGEEVGRSTRVVITDEGSATLGRGLIPTDQEVARFVDDICGGEPGTARTTTGSTTSGY